jgi:hypothetical protein
LQDFGLTAQFQALLLRRLQLVALLQDEHRGR